jgi:hypothetical protein
MTQSHLPSYHLSLSFQALELSRCLRFLQLQSSPEILPCSSTYVQFKGSIGAIFSQTEESAVELKDGDPIAHEF